MLLPEQRDVLWKRSSGGTVRNSKHNLSRCQTHHITSQDGRTDDRSRRPSFDFDVSEALQAPDPRSSSQLCCLPAPRVTAKWRRKCICILKHVDAHLPHSCLAQSHECDSPRSSRRRSALCVPSLILFTQLKSSGAQHAVATRYR